MKQVVQVRPLSHGSPSLIKMTVGSTKLSRLFQDGAWGDSDGMANGVIKVIGALAVDAIPRFLRIQRLPNGVVTGQLEGWPGNKYRIEGSADLKTWNAVWVETPRLTPLTFEDYAAQLQPRQFYRALWLPE